MKAPNVTLILKIAVKRKMKTASIATLKLKITTTA